MVPEAGVSHSLRLAQGAALEPHWGSIHYCPRFDPCNDQYQKQRPPKGGSCFWCRKRGSNPHGVATTGFCVLFRKAKLVRSAAAQENLGKLKKSRETRTFRLEEGKKSVAPDKVLFRERRKKHRKSEAKRRPRPQNRPSGTIWNRRAICH